MKSLVGKKVMALFLVMTLVSVFTLVGCGQAQKTDAFPTKPIKILIPHKAGSSTDTMARALQPYFQKYLGENAAVVVENVDGGGGNKCHSQTFKAEPDGYTLEMAAFPSTILGELVKDGEFKSLEYTFLYNVTGGVDCQ